VVYIVFRFIKNLGRGSYSEAGSEFRQAGVVVDYKKGTISVKGKKIPVDKVKSVRWERDDGGMLSFAIIHFYDMKMPVHKIEFSRLDDAEKFSNRISIAVEKAKNRDVESSNSADEVSHEYLGKVITKKDGRYFVEGKKFLTLGKAKAAIKNGRI
jgi:hypothetical protein